MPIDVLICAHNATRYFPLTLESLRAQSTGAEAFRVIFVDSASTDGTPETLDRHAKGLHIEYVYEAKVGKNAACNAGYARARSRHVAHLDADTTADRDWLENILRVIRDVGPPALGGRCYPYYVTPRPAWFLDRYNSFSYGDEPRFLDRDYLIGMNMAWERSVVERLGGFREDVGVTGRGLGRRGDETNLFIRARREIPEFKAYYDPRIVVRHVTRPEWFTMRYWMARSFLEGRYSYEAWEQSRSARPSSGRLLGRSLRLVAASGTKAALAVLRRDRSLYPYWKNYWWERVLPDVFALGQLWAR